MRSVRRRTFFRPASTRQWTRMARKRSERNCQLPRELASCVNEFQQLRTARRDGECLQPALSVDELALRRTRTELRCGFPPRWRVIGEMSIVGVLLGNERYL